MLMGYTVQNIWKAWKALAEAADLAPPSNFVSLYILFNSGMEPFSVLSKLEQKLAPREQSHHLLHEKSAFHNEVDMDCATWTVLNPLDAALWFVIYI